MSQGICEGDGNEARHFEKVGDNFMWIFQSNSH